MNPGAEEDSREEAVALGMNLLDALFVVLLVAAAVVVLLVAALADGSPGWPGFEEAEDEF